MADRAMTEEELERIRRLVAMGSTGTAARLLLSEVDRRGRRMTRLAQVLELAVMALDDLGACDDPKCGGVECNHALSLAREQLAEMGRES